MSLEAVVAASTRLAEEQEKWQAYRRALADERDKYLRRGLPERVAMVDAELERVADPPGGRLLTAQEITSVRAEAKGERQRNGRIAALLEGRRGYELRGLADRMAGVDAELSRLGVQVEAPVKRRGRRRAQK